MKDISDNKSVTDSSKSKKYTIFCPEMKQSITSTIKPKNCPLCNTTLHKVNVVRLD